jgi:uncharacterized protein YueI
MKTLIISILLILSFNSSTFSQNYLGQSKEYIVSDLEKDQSKFQNGITNSGTKYIKVIEDNSSRVYYLENNICFKYQIITFSERNYLQFISTLNNKYDHVSQNKWVGKYCSIITYSDKTESGDTIYIFEYTAL